MIAIQTDDGVLRVYVEMNIPASDHGRWDVARHGKLAMLIEEYVDAAELVDAGLAEMAKGASA